MSATAQPVNDGRRERGQLTWGIILVTIGAVFMAERLGYIVDEPWRFWPLIFVVVAAGKVIGRCEGRLRSAFALVWLAAIFLMHNFELLMLRDSWPLFVILAGVMTLWKAMAPPAGPAAGAS